MNRIEILVNQTAGALWHRDNTTLADLLPNLQADYNVHEPPSYETFLALLRSWQANPPKSIVIAGGDGTISTVWKHLLGKEITYGIIPIGSLNNIAGRLDIPSDPEAAIRVINTGTVSRVDAGEVNGHPFFESVGAGLVANIMKRAGNQDKDKNIARVARVALKAILSHEPFNVSVKIDNQALVIRTPWLTVSNLGTIGPALVDPTADPESRKLSLVYCKELTKAQLALASVEFLRQQHLDGKYFESLECSDITIKTRKPVTFHVDDQIVKTDSVTIGVLPGVLSVIRPA